MSSGKRTQQELLHATEVLPNLTQQSRSAATGGQQVASTMVKKTVEKIFEGVTTVVKQGATQAKNLVSEKIVVQLADVLVVGGGLSGLTVAEAILEKSKTLRVFVLESSDRVGGRAKTDTIHVGNSSLSVDLGASWISQKDHMNIIKMCERFQVEFADQYGDQINEGRHVYVKGTPESRRSYTGDIPALSVLVLWEIQYRVLRKLNALVQKVPVNDPWAFPEAQELDRESVASYFYRRLRASTSKDFVDSIVSQLCGCQASQISLLSFLHFIRCSNSSISGLLSTSREGCMGTRLVGGTQQLCEKLAETIKTYEEGHVETGAHVVQIRARSLQSDHPVVVTTADGKRYLARSVVIATCPSTFFHQCSFVPRLPRSIERFGMITFQGTASKAFVIYPGPWWRGAAFSGFARNIKPTPSQCVSVVYDYCGMQTAIEGSRARDAYGLVCLISGDVAVEVAGWPEEKRKESILSSLALMFPNNTDLSSKPLAYQDYFSMRRDSCSNGGPFTVYPPGQFCEYNALKLLRNPLGHNRDGAKRPLIFFSSTETSTSFPGSLEGACARGKDVATEVNNALAQLGRRRAGGGENESDQFFHEEEAGGMIVLEDDNWVPIEPVSVTKKRGFIPH